MTTTRAGILGAIAVVGGIVVVALIVLSRPSAPAAGDAASASLAAGGATRRRRCPPKRPHSSPASSVGSEHPSPSSASPSIKGLVRVDQLGFTPDETKVAYLLAAAPAEGATFTVVDAAGAEVLRGTAGPNRGPWNDAWPSVQPLDLTALNTPGTYRIEMTGRGGGVVTELHDRDGGGPVRAPRGGRGRVLPGAAGRRRRDPRRRSRRKPSHLNDRDLASTRGRPTKTRTATSSSAARSTASTATSTSRAAGSTPATSSSSPTRRRTRRPDVSRQRELGDAAPADLTAEARFGLDWLRKAWDPRSGRCTSRSGSAPATPQARSTATTTCGGCPRRDDTLAGRGEPVPALSAGVPGQRPGDTAAAEPRRARGRRVRPGGPGRRRGDPARARRELATAAAIFRRAKTAKVTEADVVTALPHAFYPESSWRDDLELGAAELALAGQALGDPRAGAWLRRQRRLGRRVPRARGGPRHAEPLRHERVAHADLVRAMRAAPR